MAGSRASMAGPWGWWVHGCAGPGRRAGVVGGTCMHDACAADPLPTAHHPHLHGHTQDWQTCRKACQADAGKDFVEECKEHVSSAHRAPAPPTPCRRPSPHKTPHTSIDPLRPSPCCPPQFRGFFSCMVSHKDYYQPMLEMFGKVEVDSKRQPAAGREAEPADRPQQQAPPDPAVSKPAVQPAAPPRASAPAAAVEHAQPKPSAPAAAAAEHTPPKHSAPAAAAAEHAPPKHIEPAAAVEHASPKTAAAVEHAPPKHSEPAAAADHAPPKPAAAVEHAHPSGHAAAAAAASEPAHAKPSEPAPAEDHGHH